MIEFKEFHVLLRKKGRRYSKSYTVMARDRNEAVALAKAEHFEGIVVEVREWDGIYGYVASD